jgi:hypothetical protein
MFRNRVLREVAPCYPLSGFAFEPILNGWADVDASNSRGDFPVDFQFRF